MTDKEKKLTEALKEYFGKDVGNVTYADAESITPIGMGSKRYILITTEPHKPTLKEKRKELVDQLDKDLKEIDGGFDVKIERNDICIWYYAGRLCELYGKDDMHFYSTYLKVKKMTKVMETISGFSWELKRLKEQYKDEAI